MKTLTKKQRGEIYLKVAEKFEEVEWYGLCIALIDIGLDYPQADVNNSYRYAELSKKLFPEFQLFKPNERPRIGLWWDIIDGKEVRQTALLLCYEMTK